MPRYRTSDDTYEIRGPGGIGEISNIPFLGKTLATLKDMAKHGYVLYINGKRAKLNELTDAAVRKAWTP